MKYVIKIKKKQKKLGVFNNHLSLTLQTLHKFRIIIPCTACYGILQSHALIKYYYLSVCLFCMNLLNRMGGDGETYKLFDSVDTRKKIIFIGWNGHFVIFKRIFYNADALTMRWHGFRYNINMHKSKSGSASSNVFFPFVEKIKTIPTMFPDVNKIESNVQ